MKNFTVGIDIGGTNTVFGLVDEAGEILKTGNIETQIFAEAKDFAKNLSNLMKTKIAELPADYRLAGIGIGVPNGNYYTGHIEFAPNLPWKGEVPMVELFKEYFQVPIFVTNDANAAAMGEKIYGGAKEMNDFVVITLGTGLGSGIFANGKILYGKDSTAGEYGHVTVVPNGRICGCGRKGCLETYVSATGIRRNAFYLMSERMDNSVLRSYSYNDLTSKSIFQAADAGDLLANQIFEYTGDILGKAIADIYSIFNPEAVFIFGGLANAKDYILAPARISATQNSLKIHQEKIKIFSSHLKGDDAAILGASALVMGEIQHNLL